MAKKQVDINLFKAASKSDKKIQTGISKSFIFVLLGLVLIVVFALYIGMLYMENADLQTQIDEYKSKTAYLTNINIISNQIEEDKLTLAALQSQINAANSIASYAHGTSVLYPGVTSDQLDDLMTYASDGGLLPVDIIQEDDLSGIRLQYSYTDGIAAYDILEYSETTMSYSAASRVFENGYMIIRFETTNEEAAEQYVQNIVASDMFAIEEGIMNRDILTAASFEVGFIDMPDMGATNYVMYIKCKLKPIFKIINEDDLIQSNIEDITQMSFSSDSITISLTTRNYKSIHSLCANFYALGLFDNVDFNSETWLDGGHCQGTIVLQLEGKAE